MDDGEFFDLDVVGIIEGTDKSSAVSFAWDYLRHYDKVLSKFRHQPFNLIEIGVADGASLKVWKSYFPRAQIIGIDIVPQCTKFTDDCIHIEIGSQEDPEFLWNVCKKYPPSVIIDDGSHLAHHVIFSFERMFPYLASGGVYIIEDVTLHYGHTATNFVGLSNQSLPDYLLRLASSRLAATPQGPVNESNAVYQIKSVDSLTFVSGAAIISKREDIGKHSCLSFEFAKGYIDRSNHSAEAHERLSQFIIAHFGPPDDAETQIKKAIEIGGETPHRLKIYSDVRWRQGCLADAAVIAERSAILGNSPEMWVHAGKLYRAAGDSASATRAQEMAKDLHA